MNVPYYYDGCTCSYPLPIAMALVALPQSNEQWSSWGPSEIAPGKLQRLGINFGAPGDRMTREGTLWLDYPSVGGPSPTVNIETTESTQYRYQHSVWMQGSESHPWVTASMAEGLERCVIKDLKPGNYVVRLYFAEPESTRETQRVQTIKLQGQTVADDFEVIDETGSIMQGTVKKFANIQVQSNLTLKLSSTDGVTIISGIEILRQDP